MDKSVKLSTGRISWIDISKGITILLVILGHVLPDGNFLKNIIFSFHMPLFFFISGYLFKITSCKEITKKGFCRIIAPGYVCVLLIYFGYVIFNYFFKAGENENIFICLIKLLISLVYMSGDNVKQLEFIKPIGAVWFLTALFLIRIIVAFLENKKINRLKILCILMFSSFVGYKVGKVIFLPWSLDIVPLGATYFYIGFLCKEGNWINRITEKINAVYLATASCLLMIFGGCLGLSSMNSRLYPNFYLFFVFSFFGIIFTIILSNYLAKKENLIKKFLTFSGKQSLCILLIHQLESYYGAKIYDMLPFNELFLFLLRLGIIYVTVIIVGRFKVFRKMFGYVEDYK